MKYSIYTLFLFLVAFSACETEFSDLNNDPGALTSAELRLQLPEVIVQSMHNEGSNVNRIAGTVMQQFGGLDAQQIDNGNYLLGEDAVNNYWVSGLYSGALRGCQVIIDQAAEEGATFYSGVAKILMANQYGIATSFFGEMPFTEALQGLEVRQPSYDAQEIIYAGVQDLLDSGISDLENATGFGGGDLIFNGDETKWIATARALKARFLMQTQRRDNSAAAAALTELSSAFASFEDQPNFTFESSQTANWALAKFGIERPSTLGIASSFTEMMDGDPRQIHYMVDLGNLLYDYYQAEADNPNLTWAQSAATIPLISLVEVRFLQAEALARTGASAAEVETALADAISASMTAVGVTDEVAINDYVAANSSISGDGIENIITEAYKAYYGFAFHESWANFRRTGFPALTPSPNGVNSANPSGGVPRRLQYVDSESATNSVNVQAARDRQGGGLLDQDVWAFE